MSTYRVEYNHGLQVPTLVQANSIEEAKREGLAHYRKNAGYADTVDFFPIDFVVKSVEPVEVSE